MVRFKINIASLPRDCRQSTLLRMQVRGSTRHIAAQRQSSSQVNLPHNNTQGGGGGIGAINEISGHGKGSVDSTYRRRKH